MDLSPEYMQMCRQAKEIQEQWSLTNGDVIHIPKGIRYEEYNDYGEGNQEEPKTICYYDDGGRYYSFNHVYMEGLVVGTVFSENPHGRRYKLDDVVWLPCQDQLMQLTKKQGRGMALLLSLCLEVDYSPKQDYFIAFETIEQLLLAHVMFFNHNKIWNGSGWVAEE